MGELTFAKSPVPALVRFLRRGSHAGRACRVVACNGDVERNAFYGGIDWRDAMPQTCEALSGLSRERVSVDGRMPRQVFPDHVSAAN